MSVEGNMDNTLRNIADLQRREKALYEKLNSEAGEKEKEDYAAQINDLSDLRATMYASLSDVFGMQTAQAEALNETLLAQKAVVVIAEDELNALKKRDNLLRDARTQELRMIEINTYYSKKYAAQSKTMRIAAVGLAIAIAIVAFYNFFDAISKTYPRILLTVLGVVMAWKIGRRLFDASNRSPTNYDQYTFFFNKSDGPSASSVDATDEENASDPWAATDCSGAACCAEGTTFDSALGQCTK